MGFHTFVAGHTSAGLGTFLYFVHYSTIGTRTIAKKDIMNFRPSIILDDVTDFAAFDKGHFVIHNGTQLNCITESGSIILYNEGLQIHNITVEKSAFFWCTHTLNSPFSLWGDISKPELRKVDFIIKTVQESFLYCSQNGVGKKIDFSGKEIWSSTIKFIVAYYDKLVYVKNSKTSIIALNETNGSIVWEYSLPDIEVIYDGKRVENIQISNIIGAYNSMLWIVLSTGFLIAIDLENGKEKYLIKMPSNSPEGWEGKESFAEAKKSVLCEKEGKIFGIDDETYWEMDLHDPVKTYKYFNFEPNNHRQNKRIRATLAQPLNWQCDEIVIGQQEFGQQSSYVGIYNRKSRLITWSSHELGEKGEFTGLRKIQLYDNLLYILDAKNTLHVFER